MEQHKHTFTWWVEYDENKNITGKYVACRKCHKFLDDIIYEMQVITGAFT